MSGTTCIILLKPPQNNTSFLQPLQWNVLEVGYKLLSEIRGQILSNLSNSLFKIPSKSLYSIIYKSKSLNVFCGRNYLWPSITFCSISSLALTILQLVVVCFFSCARLKILSGWGTSLIDWLEWSGFAYALGILGVVVEAIRLRAPFLSFFCFL